MDLDKIVIAVDKSPDMDDVLAWAGVLATALQATVTLINVSAPGHEREGEAVLAAAVGKLGDTGLKVERMLLHGVGRGIVPAINSAATHLGASLIVAGSSGRTELSTLLRGSTSKAILSTAPCPVLIVRPGRSAGPLRRILLAVDGTDGRNVAIDLAASLVSKFGAQVHVLHVPEIGVAPEGVYYVESEADAQSAVDDALGRFAAKGVRAVGHLSAPVAEIPRQVVAAIISEARSVDADLIVTASRGLSPMKGLLLGSVARTLLHFARRPVLVVHKPLLKSDGADASAAPLGSTSGKRPPPYAS